MIRLLPVPALLAAAAVSIAQTPVYNDHTADFEKLTKGVKDIPLYGTPCNIVVSGPDAFSLVNAASAGRVASVIAATRLGKGLILLFGHGAYLSQGGLEAGDTMTLVENAIKINQTRERQTRVAVYRSGQVAAALSAKGHLVKEFGGAGWAQEAKTYDAIVTSIETLGSTADRNAILAYVRNGGVFISAVNGWGWLQVSRRTDPTIDLATDMHHNLLLRDTGLTYGGGYIGAIRPIDVAEIPLTHCQFALQSLLAHRDKTKQLDQNQLDQMTGLLISAVESVHPLDTIVRKPIAQVIALAGDNIVPTAAKPLGANAPIDRLALYIRAFETAKTPQNEITANPAASDFPGVAPSDAQRTDLTIDIDGDIPGWKSTGLWINAGETVTVTVPERLKDKGIRIRLGAHSDTLWHHRAWSRHPSITREFAVTDVKTEARSEFGGLVYIVLPNNASFGSFQATVKGAVRSPRYVLGETTLSQWLEVERSQPAPWAELQTDSIIITVPSEVVRDLDDPDKLMQHWNKVMDTYADLSMRPLNKRQQRLVPDVQISAGYMHAGYPIMMLMDQPNNLVSVHKQAQGTRDNWGFWHELGHNHQHPDWTFGGTTEVTCNLFSIYVLQHIYGTELMTAGAYNKANMEKYFADGSKFATWQGSPFLALMMYVQLIDDFGWDTFKKVFAEYRNLPAGERPRNDQQKRDQWLVRFSRAVGRDLGPFFQKWGVPTSQSARDSVSDLPVWMHMDIGT